MSSDAATTAVGLAKAILEIQRISDELETLHTDLKIETDGAKKETLKIEIAKLVDTRSIAREEEAGLFSQVLHEKQKQFDFEVPRATADADDLDPILKNTGDLFEGKLYSQNPLPPIRLTRPVKSSSFTQSASNSGARLQRPPKFKKGDNFNRFAKRFREHVLLSGTQSDQLHYYMLSYIDCETTWEKLSDLSDSLSNKEKANIDRLIAIYTAELFPPTEARAMRTELQALRQKETESLEDFSFRIKEAAGKAAYDSDNLRNECSLQTLIAGVRDSEIKKKLLENDVTSFSEALKIALKQERIVAAVKGDTVDSNTSDQMHEGIFRIDDKGINSSSPRSTNPNSNEDRNFTAPRDSYRRSDSDYDHNQQGNRSNGRNFNDRSSNDHNFNDRNFNDRNLDDRNFNGRITNGRYYNDRGNGRSNVNRQYSGRNNSNVECWNCGRRGHMSFECTYPRNPNMAGNQRQNRGQQSRDNGRYSNNNRRLLNYNGAARQ